MYLVKSFICQEDILACVESQVKNNLKDLTDKNIYQTIEESTSIDEDKVLPGLGVIFEVIWNSSDKNQMVNKFVNNL